MPNNKIEVRSLNEQIDQFISTGRTHIDDSDVCSIQVILTHPSEDNPIKFIGRVKSLFLGGDAGSFNLKALAFKDGKEKAINYCLEKGYITEPVKLFCFSTALTLLKTGVKITRTGWNGKNMWLAISCADSKEVAAANFWSQHNADFARSNGGKATVAPCLTFKNAQDQIVMGWIPSSGDLFANDWMIAE